MPDKLVMGFTYIHLLYRRTVNQGKIEGPSKGKKR